MLCLLFPQVALCIELGYRFELIPGVEPRMFIHVEFVGAPDGVTILEVSEEWGGVTAGGEDFVAATAASVTGTALPVERTGEHQLLVRHRPGETVTVSVLISSNDYQSSARRSDFRRPILNQQLFRTVGQLGLPRPNHIDHEQPLEVYFRWDGFAEAGWQVVSSWGAGSDERVVRATLNDITGGLYLAGEVAVLTREIYGKPLTVTVAGDGWGFTPEAFADVCAKIVEVERGFFDDYDRDFYWISLVPTGEPKESGYSIGGTALTNCFSLSVHPNAGLPPDDPSGGELVRILAHEMFHEWNGQVIAREDPEELVYWFSEGFTDFYTRRLLFRGGLIDTDAYAASASRTIERYLTSPVRNEPNQRIFDDYWTDPDVQKLPYYRGDVVAMILDARIRARSGGAQSLDDMMRELVEEARAGARVSTDRLLLKFAAWAGQETAEAIRHVVVAGETAVIPTDLFFPCLDAEAHDAYAFDVGFDFQASADARMVRGVREGSAAHAAGLREGMRLLGWSVHGGDTTAPVKLQVEDNGVEREIEYLPRGPVSSVYRFSAVPGASCSHL
jgi:predicted metalloprotease with PDZ domain